MVNLLQKDSVAPHHSILCVDDEPHILDALSITLGRRYHVEMASGGKVALEILRAVPTITVIISDMRMPTMNGAQFLAASRKLAPNARRILLTGHADVASAILAVNEGGIFRFLTKPCPFSKLVEAVEAAMADFDDDVLERSAIRRIVTRDVLSRDSLTGLATREILLNRLDLCQCPGTPGDWRSEIVFVIEMSGVDEISDVYDSQTIDRLVSLSATRLQKALPTAQCLARYRESTFAALVVPEDSSEAALELLATDIIHALQQPMELDGVDTPIRATVGIARIPAGASNPRGALRHAELAAREARRHGNDPIRFFSRESMLKNDRRWEVVQALRAAVARQELCLHYQPIIDIQNNCVYSLEALARWDHATLGSVSPSLFIPLAEETGLMIPLGEWVINRACTDAGELCATVCRRVSVNVSVAQILDSRFMYSLYKALQDTGADPTALQIELTETVFAEDLERVCKVLSEVRLLGMSVAIDDFGVGYSSLSYLSRLPVDVLKIDRMFVQDFDRGGKAIIVAALALADMLKIAVVVEGVETELDLERVRALGARKVQGFVFAHPMPAARILDWYARFEDQLGGGLIYVR